METPTLAFVPGFMQRGDAWAPVAEWLGERYPSVLHDHATDLPERGTVPVAYSMGGRLVLHAALEEPDRWPALVLVGVRAGVDDQDARRQSDEELAAWMERHAIEEVVERWESAPVFGTQTPEQRDAQRPGRLRHDPAELAAQLRRYGQGAMPAIWDRLGAIHAPVLLLAGALDDPYVTSGRRMAYLLPNASFSTIPDTGHAPQVENPGAVAQEIDAFLR
jgi:2-succinyl-6-hydroxy-2,4-cyclohexadiene-1-carboxylate synthase